MHFSLAIAIIALLLTGCSANNTEPSSHNEVENTALENVAQSTQTYHNAKYQVQFTYPKHWSITTSEETDTRTLLSLHNTNHTYSFEGSETSPLTISIKSLDTQNHGKGIAETLHQQAQHYPIKITKDTTNNTKILRFSGAMNGIAFPQMTTNGRQIEFVIESSVPITDDNRNDLLPIIDQIAQTLKMQ